MSKYSSLSRLADLAHREITGGDEPYPVKRKGERRRLDPNWLGIAWLEADTLNDTEIFHTYQLGDGLTALIPYGKARAKGSRSTQCRRMIDLFPLDVSSSQLAWQHPCPDCDNFAYTARCGVHPERGKEAVVEPRGIVDSWRQSLGQIEEARGHVVRGQWVAGEDVRRHLLADMTFPTPTVTSRIEQLEDGSTILHVRDSAREMINDVRRMTFGEWREQNGIG